MSTVISAELLLKLGPDSALIHSAKLPSITLLVNKRCVFNIPAAASRCVIQVLIVSWTIDYAETVNKLDPSTFKRVFPQLNFEGIEEIWRLCD